MASCGFGGVPMSNFSAGRGDGDGFRLRKAIPAAFSHPEAEDAGGDGLRTLAPALGLTEVSPSLGEGAPEMLRGFRPRRLAHGGSRNWIR